MLFFGLFQQCILLKFLYLINKKTNMRKIKQKTSTRLVHHILNKIVISNLPFIHYMFKSHFI